MCERPRSRFSFTLYETIIMVALNFPRTETQKERANQMGIRNSIKGGAFMDCAKGMRLPLLIMAATLVATTARPADPKEKPNAENKLVGTWKLVSAKYGGQDFVFEEGITTLKHVTPTQFMWASFDKTGKVTRSAGGDYTLEGEVYEETPEYGISSDFDEIKGKAQVFKWKLEGNKWYHKGKLSNGLTIEEVWERVQKK